MEAACIGHIITHYQDEQTGTIKILQYSLYNSFTKRKITIKPSSIYVYSLFIKLINPVSLTQAVTLIQYLNSRFITQY